MLSFMGEVETAATKKLIRGSKKNVAGKSAQSSPDKPAPKNLRDASPIPKLNTENKLFRVELSGYGAELVYGNITKQQYEYWVDKELDDLVGDWNNEIEISEDLRFIKNGDWVECDNLIHRHACEFSDESKLIVYSGDGALGERACIVTLTADVVIPNRKPDSSFDLKATLNEKAYRTGDVLTILLEPTVPMHVAIFNWVPYQDRDTVTQMFPNPMDPQSHITKKTSIPTVSKISAYDLTMTWLESLPKNKTFVDEYLIVIGTKKPIKWLSSYEFSEFKLKLSEIPLDEMRVVKRGYQLIRGSNKVGSVQ